MSILDFLRPREKFLVLEILPGRNTGLLLSVDRDKNLVPEKSWDDFSFAYLEKDPLKFLRKRNLVVSAHPSFTAAVSFPVDLIRDERDAALPVTAREIESLLAREMSAAVNHHRKKAGDVLDVHELDAVLVGARAADFKVDNHFVLNPLGFRCERVSAVLELTFTTRQVFEDLKDFFSSHGRFFFTSSPRAALGALSKIVPLPISFALIGAKQSYCFSLERAARGNSVKRKDFGWSYHSLFEAISAATEASPPVVMEFYYRFLGGEMSENMLRRVERLLKPETDKVLRMLRGIVSSGRVYFHSPAPLPFKYPLRFGRVTLEEPPIEYVLEKFGFNTSLVKWPLDRGEAFLRLAPFLEFYFDKSDSEVNRLLWKKVHWLAE